MAKRAAVVIHGIGQQQPYEMARAFANGLLQIAPRQDQDASRLVFLEQVIPPMPAQPDTQVPPGRIYRARAADNSAIVDVYEAYWAPLTTGMTNFFSIVGWIIVNTFIPSRLLRVPSWKTVYDAVFTVVFLAIVALLYYGLFGALLLTTMEVLRDLSHQPPPVPTLHPLALGPTLDAARHTLGHLLWDSWSAPSRIELDKASLGAVGRVLSPLTFGWLLATAVGIYCLFQVLFRLMELAMQCWRDLRSSGNRVLLRWPPGRLVGHLVILLLLGFAYLRARSYVTSEFFAYGYIYVVFRLLYMWLKKYFVDYIGDIEVYVTRDSKSARFAAREQIRSSAVDAIKAALMSTENYTEVLVFGHSLGSVIGLDAIRELRREAGRTALTGAQFDRLTCFVTFGSPLEKTRFFFERISPNDPGQWRDFLDEVQKTFLEDAETRRIYWTNFWYFADVVANSLESYNDGVPDLVRLYRLRKRGVWVHSDYVLDAHFLAPVYRRLVLGPPPLQQLPPDIMGNAETIVVR